MIRRIVATILCGFALLWMSPALLMLTTVLDTPEGAEQAIGLSFAMHGVVFIIPSLILIGLAALVWPSKNPK